MELTHELNSVGIAGANRTLERLRPLFQLLEVGVTGKTAGLH
jgi:hypothetical protein